MTTVIGSRMVNGAGVKYHSVGAGPPLHITIGTGHLIRGEGRKRKPGRPEKQTLQHIKSDTQIKSKKM